MSNIKDRLLLLQKLAKKPSIQLPYDRITKVISAESLQEHIQLYQGYQDLLLRLDTQIQEFDHTKLPQKHLMDSLWRALKEAETYAMGGITLHKLYFENLTDQPKENDQLEIKQTIIKRFGSFQNWFDQFKATCMITKGWVVFAMNKNNCRILMLDSHNIGTMFDYIPLLVIDLFEHAYIKDHGTNRVPYIEGIMECINFDVVNRRYINTQK